MQNHQAGILRVGGKALAPSVGLLFFATVALGQTGTSIDPSPRVIFSSPGLKQVTLRVCNDFGCHETSRQVQVLDPLPQIQSLGSIPPLVGVGQTVTLSAQTAGRPSLNHRWIVSGGAADLVLTGNPSVWNTGLSGIGTYGVRLEVQNTDGTATSTPAPVRVERMTFADVPPTHWAWSFIEGLYSSGITNGCAADPVRYCPATLVNRAEMAVFLIRATHSPSFVPLVAVGSFSDVLSSFWAAPQIEQLYADGLTTGCAASPLRYCPASFLTRAEMAVFLLRARHGGAYIPPAASGSLFADVPADYWAVAWIEQLHAEGITTGCLNTPLRFCPEDSVTREQMAAFLTRTFNLPLP